MSRPEFDSWVKDAFGVDPAGYTGAAQTGAHPEPPAGQPKPDRAASQRELSAMAERWSVLEAGIHDDLEALRAEFAAEYDGDEGASLIQAELKGHVETIIKTFDGALQTALRDAANAQGDNDLAAAISTIRSQVKEYVGFLASDKTIEIIEDNPFLEIDIRGPCKAALAEVVAAIKHGAA